MTDEEYIFRTECAEKKRTARGSFNRLSHAGRGGKVKMPSDYLTKKEREAMNGEVITYQMNRPMSWAQFKKMPDDTKREYINSIIHKYDPQQTAVAAMFGVTPRTLYVLCEELGIRFKRSGTQRENRNDAFWAWVNSATVAEPEQKSTPPKPTPPKPTLIIDGVDCSAEIKIGGQESINGVNLRHTIPISGTMEFNDATVPQAFNAVYALLAGKSLNKLVISWGAAHE